jgi:hypothetical protein
MLFFLLAVMGEKLPSILLSYHLLYSGLVGPCSDAIQMRVLYKLPKRDE